MIETMMPIDEDDAEVEADKRLSMVDEALVAGPSPTPTASS